jgi:hypothetical protein
VDSDSPRRQFVQQRPHCGRDLTVSRYDRCPFQVLSERPRDDLPSIETKRRCRSDLKEGPVPNERTCDLPGWQWTAHDEMIVAMHQNSDHGHALKGDNQERDNRSRNGTPPVRARALFRSPDINSTLPPTRLCIVAQPHGGEVAGHLSQSWLGPMSKQPGTRFPLLVSRIGPRARFVPDRMSRLSRLEHQQPAPVRKKKRA